MCLSARRYFYLIFLSLPNYYAGVPGDAKNDRLFDTWQDFGMIQLSPQGKAIWYATVHGQDGDGYAHRLSLLRFPLAKLWDDPTQYPAVMNGRIEPHLKDEARAPDTETVLSAPAVDADESTAQELDQKAMATAVVDADDLVDHDQQAPNASGAAPGSGDRAGHGDRPAHRRQAALTATPAGAANAAPAATQNGTASVIWLYTLVPLPPTWLPPLPASFSGL